MIACIAVVFAAFATSVVVAPAARAAGVLGITKSLADVQGNGFTKPNTVQTNGLVRYRLTVQCSSLQTDCGVTTLSDTLDPSLSVSDVMIATTDLVTKQVRNGQQLQLIIGTPEAPFPGGRTLEVYVTAKVTSYPTDNPKDATGNAIVSNTAVATSTDAPTATSETVDIIVPPVADHWGISKKVAAPTGNPSVGEPVTYHLRLTNTKQYGEPNVASSTIVDTYPAGATVYNKAALVAAGWVVDEANHTLTYTKQKQKTSSLNCSTGSCFQDVPLVVQLVFPAPTFTDGASVDNKVAATLTFDDGRTKDVDSSASVTLAAPVASYTLTKTGSATAATDGTVAWTVKYVNTGNVVATGLEIIDTLPAGVKDLDMWHSSYVEPIRNQGDLTAEHKLDALVDGAWTTVSSGNGLIWGPKIPAGATKVRFVAPKLLPGDYVQFSLRGTVTAAEGTDMVNCATFSSTTAGLAPTKDACATTKIVKASSSVAVDKGHVYLSRPGQTSVEPGEEFLFGISLYNQGELAATTATLVDYLPPQFEYIATVCSGRMGGGGASAAANMIADKARYCTNPILPTSVETVDTPAAGTTKISWTNVALTPALNDSWLAQAFAIKVRVRSGDPMGTYTNTALGITGPFPVATCRGTRGSAPDTDDIDANPATTTVCRGSNDVQVVKASAVEMTKWDLGTVDPGMDPVVTEADGKPSPNCPNWDGFTRYPCVAVTKKDSDFSYRFKIQNIGNTDVSDFTAYDILPYLGDTGVGQVLGAQKRATQWSPVLTGPVSVESAPQAAAPTIMYSTSTNPCRPELTKPGGGTAWLAGCDDTWKTAEQVGGDWASIKSFRVRMYQGTDGVYPAWHPMETIVLRATMHAPKAALPSTLSPLNLSVAWNSIAHHESRLDAANGTTPARLTSLEPSEPRKVGVIVPFVATPLVSVGDRVWYDENSNGRQDQDERPAGGITVDLRDAQTHEVISSTTTDDNGYYWFTGLTPSASYELAFTKPAGYTWTTPRAGDDRAVDSDVDAQGIVRFTAPAKGANKPGAPDLTDDPTLDAGLVVVPTVPGTTPPTVPGTTPSVPATPVLPAQPTSTPTTAPTTAIVVPAVPATTPTVAPVALPATGPGARPAATAASAQLPFTGASAAWQVLGALLVIAMGAGAVLFSRTSTNRS